MTSRQRIALAVAVDAIERIAMEAKLREAAVDRIHAKYATPNAGEGFKAAERSAFKAGVYESILDNAAKQLAPIVDELRTVFKISRLT